MAFRSRHGFRGRAAVFWSHTIVRRKPRDFRKPAASPNGRGKERGPAVLRRAIARTEKRRRVVMTRRRTVIYLLCLLSVSGIPACRTGREYRAG